MLYTVFNLCTSSDTPQSTGLFGNPVMMIVLLVVMFGAMYFLTIRPQKKRQQEEQEMRSAVDVGDEITTIGGICGRVVTVKEEHLIIETGADRNRMQITRWAIQQNNTANERLAAERAAAKEAAEKAKQEKLEANGKKPRKKKGEDE